MAIDPILALTALTTSSEEAYKEVMTQAGAIEQEKPGAQAEAAKAKPETPAAQVTAPEAPATPSASPLDEALNTPVAEKPSGAEPVIPEPAPIVNADAVVVIDPNKIIRLPDGREVPWSKLAGEMYLKEKYDKEKLELEATFADKEQKLEQEKKIVSDGAYWLNLAANDPLAAPYLQGIRSGVPPEIAAEAAFKMAGFTMQGAQRTQEQTDPRLTKPSGYDDDDPEVRKWEREVYFPALAEKKAAELLSAELAKRDFAQQQEAERLRKEQERQQAIAAEVTKIADTNKKTLSTIPDFLYRQYGIAPAALTQEQRDDLTKRLNTSALSSGLNINSDEWLRTNVITERDLELIALKAIGEKNPYTAPAPAPDLIKPRIEPEPPLRPGTDGGISTQGGKENKFSDMYEHPAILALRELSGIK